jgi:hypothetical protein
MTIPASRIARINPGVVNSGGTSLVMNGLFLTQNTQMPTASVFNFASPAAVAGIFGPASAEAALAKIYFAGYSNSTIKPGGMLFAPYNLAARSGFIQGGSLAGLSLAQLEALSGTLILTVAGVVETSAAIDLSAAGSFSGAAALIQAGFTTPPFTVAWNAVASAFVITTTATGSAETITFATGTLAAALKMNQATGAFLSQGAVLDTPATAMANAVRISQNFASVVTLWEPNLSDKEGFAVWFNAANLEYLYLGWDSDPNASVQGNTTSFGAVAKAAQYNGVACISGDPALALATGTTLAALALNVATFAAGAIASINFAATKGRVTLAFLAQAGMAPTVADDQISQNLLANGYSFYGSYATANDGFVFFYNGQIPGEFGFIDSFVNQIYLNSQFQLAMLTLLTNIGDFPYTPDGYGLLRSALMDPIDAALAFGSIHTGVTLSAAQISEVNQAAGVDAASVIQTAGFYLQILDPGAQVRGLRGSPIVNFWYADGGAVQQITMASIDIL